MKTNLIVTMGELATHSLLNTKSSLESLRNMIHRYGDTPLIVTYHPAHLIQNPAEKKKAYSDLLLIQRTLKGIQDASLSTTAEQALSNSTT